MTVHIVLLENSNADRGTQQNPIWHCGQEIDGHLEVVTSRNLVFDIEVSFEGY